MKEPSSRFMSKVVTPLCTLLSIVAPAAASVQNANAYVQRVNPLESAAVVPQPLDYPEITMQQEIYARKVDQVRPIGNWGTYTYMGKSSVSEDVFVDYLMAHGFPSVELAKKIFADGEDQGVDIGAFAGIWQAESGLQGMNECNLRYAPDVKTVKGFARYDEFGEQGYVMAANDCFDNLVKWHGKGKTNFMDLLQTLTPRSDGNNPPEYIHNVFTTMQMLNDLSLEKDPPIQLRRRIIVPIIQLPDTGLPGPAYDLMVLDQENRHAV